MFQRPRGTRDLGPEEMARRRYAEGVFRSVCQSFGFREIATPTFEEMELFLAKSGEGILEEIYFFEDKGGRKLALRPELTAPVMRFYANELKQQPKPLKVFYFGNCFRYERPQSGRYREFWQFGVELIGPEGPLADAELLALAVGCLRALGLDGFVLRVGNLRVLGGLLDKLAIVGVERSEMLRYIDKGDKASLESFLETRCPEGAGTVMELVSLKGGSAVLEQAASLLSQIGECKTALASLSETVQLLQQYGIDDVQIDLGIARGLDYYTGMVFEIDAPTLGSENQLCGGGEYSLVKLFGAQDVPTRGFAFGFDRVLLALEKGGVSFPTRGLDVYLVPLGEEVLAEAIKLLNQMRSSGMLADMDLMGRNLSKALKYTDSLDASCVVILGARDLEKGVATVRDMKSGQQSEVELNGLIDYLKNKKQ